MNIPSLNVKIGRINRLCIIKEADHGVYLDGLKSGEILMPNTYVPAECGIGDFVDVLVYKDSEDRLVATTEEPYAMEGELAYLRVVAVTAIGAFLDWGVLKDLLLPFREQRERPREGDWVLVYVYFDTASERLVASTKLHKFIDKKSAKYHPGDEVDLIVCNGFELGYNVIVDRSYLGLIYRNEVFQPLGPCEKLKGYIKMVRPDGKIDVELNRSGESQSEELALRILDTLRQSGGFLPLTDKSPTDDIYTTFRVSKKLYKRTIGGLYRERKVRIDDDGIRLTE